MTGNAEAIWTAWLCRPNVPRAMSMEMPEFKILVYVSGSYYVARVVYFRAGNGRAMVFMASDYEGSPEAAIKGLFEVTANMVEYWQGSPVIEPGMERWHGLGERDMYHVPQELNEL